MGGMMDQWDPNHCLGITYPVCFPESVGYTNFPLVTVLHTCPRTCGRVSVQLDLALLVGPGVLVDPKKNPESYVIHLVGKG